MRFSTGIFLVFSLIISLAAVANPVAEDDQSVPAQRLRTIDHELSTLASLSLQTSVGAIGYRSKSHPDANHSEWIHIELEAESEIDLIVLVPAIWRGSQTEFEADGFPAHFDLIVGNDEHPDGILLASFTDSNAILPRIAPLTIPCPGTKARWVKLVSKRLAQRAWDDRYVLQLSEMMIFQGAENLALHRPVTTSSEGSSVDEGARQKHFLVDGLLPYLMTAASGPEERAYFTMVPENTPLHFTVDLGQSLPLNRLHLHSIDVSDTVPQANRANYAVPKKFTLEASSDPTFSNPKTLCEYHQNSIYDVGPIIPLRFSEVHARYLCFAIPTPDRSLPEENITSTSIIGFAEIELFSNGKNILKGKLLKPSFTSPQSPELLTDGSNIFGQILDTRTWIEQLARRHDLESERPKVEKQLALRYQKQEKNLALFQTLIGVLLASLVILALLSHSYRLRELAKLRRRFAADLHDEIGANLHAIGLLSDIAHQEASTPVTDSSSAILETVAEIRTTTERTAEAVRHCANSFEPRMPMSNFEGDMLRIARRMMEDLDYTITVEAEDFISQLKPRTRADLLLFYKECLVNISRHSGATSFTAKVTTKDKKLIMDISDNGQGLPNSSTPDSIRRRAKILRAQVTTESPLASGGQGTQITLSLSSRRFNFLF